MVIKTGNGTIAVDLIAIVMSVYVFITFLKDDMLSKVSIFCLGPLIFVLIIHWIVIGRTLEMSREGCTVRFLCFRKEYRWEKLGIKRVEAYRKTGDVPYTCGAIFSSHKAYKPCKPTLWRHPLNYNLLHPFSFFFVCFQVDIPKGVPDPEIYVVDEAVFIEKMKNWNVELEDTRRKAAV